MNGLPVSMYCDRSDTDLSRSQVGFLKNISQPIFEALAGFLESEKVDKNCVEQIRINIICWERKTLMKRASLAQMPKTLLGKLPQLGSKVAGINIANLPDVLPEKEE